MSEPVVESPAESPAEVQRRNAKERQGVVVSAKSDKTVIVSVERRIRHRKYKKYLAVRKRYAAHDLVGCAVGDRVKIREGRPISKNKRWRITEKLTPGSSS